MTPDPTKKEIEPCRACGGDKGHWEGCRGEADLELEISRLTSLLEEKERELCLLETLVGTFESRLKSAEKAIEMGIERIHYLKGCTCGVGKCVMCQMESALALIRGNKTY